MKIHEQPGCGYCGLKFLNFPINGMLDDSVDNAAKKNLAGIQAVRFGGEAIAMIEIRNGK